MVSEGSNLSEAELEAARQFMSRVARREFPCAPHIYKNIYEYLSDAYAHLRREGFKGEPRDHPWVKYPIHNMDRAKSMYDIEQALRSQPGLTMEQLNRPCISVAS